MVRNHPAIRQINILLELDRDHLRIHLDDRAYKPIANAISILVMITVIPQPGHRRDRLLLYLAPM